LPLATLQGVEYVTLIIGILFGWIYWKKGLEAAMVAHFSTDIVLHVIFPLFV
jgi:membrane protease YdiL (CAAX protease family)